MIKRLGMPLCLSPDAVDICGPQLRYSAVPRCCRVCPCTQLRAMVSEHGGGTERLGAIMLSFRAPVSLQIWLMPTSFFKACLQAERKAEMTT